MAERSTIARPYAQAAFELAREQDRLGAWSEVLDALARIAAEPALQALLDDPRVPRRQVAELFVEVCGDALDDQGRNFIHVLSENRRLALLPEIAEQYAALRAEAEKTVEARVASAFELDQAQQEKLATALKGYLGRDVRLVCEVDETLLGGAVIQAGDLVIDGSALGKLGRLAGQMEG